MNYAKPFRRYLANFVNVKGPDAAHVKRIARWITERTHSLYLSDRERALRALWRQAAIMAGIPPESATEDDDADSEAEGEPVTAAVPEERAPGESRSNGAAERAVRSIEDQLRTMKLALESRISCKIPCAPITKWMIEHAAVLRTTHHNDDGDMLTGHGRLHGHKPNMTINDFCESIMFYAPLRQRQKLDPRWRIGSFVWRHGIPTKLSLHCRTVRSRGPGLWRGLSSSSDCQRGAWKI